MNVIRWVIAYRRRKMLAAELGIPLRQLDSLLKRLAKEMDTWD